jgi:hypothetical protein
MLSKAHKDSIINKDKTRNPSRSDYGSEHVDQKLLPYSLFLF